MVGKKKKMAEKKKKWRVNDLSPDQLGNIQWIYSILNLKYSNHLNSKLYLGNSKELI